MAKGDRALSRKNLKRIVASHLPAQERDPRGGCAPTLAHPTGRYSSCCLFFKIAADRKSVV